MSSGCSIRRGRTRDGPSGISRGMLDPCFREHCHTFFRRLRKLPTTSYPSYARDCLDAPDARFCLLIVAATPDVERDQRACVVVIYDSAATIGADHMTSTALSDT